MFLCCIPAMVSTRKLELRSNQLTFELSKRRSLQKWHKWHKWQWFVLNRISIKWTQGHKWYLNSQNSLATCRSRFVDFVGLAWCFASRFALCYRDRSWSHETFLLVWEIIDLLGSGVQVVVHRLVPGFRGAKEKRRNDVLMFFYLIHSNSIFNIFQHFHLYSVSWTCDSRAKALCIHCVDELFAVGIHLVTWREFCDFPCCFNSVPAMPMAPRADTLFSYVFIMSQAMQQCIFWSTSCHDSELSWSNTSYKTKT